MDLQMKKQQLRLNIRNQYKHNYFNRARSLQLKYLQKLQINSTLRNYVEGQSEIMNVLVEYNQTKDSSIIKFELIRDYVSSYEGQFSYEFRNYLAEVILSDFRNCKQALSVLAELLIKQKTVELLFQIDINKCLSNLIEDNIQNIEATGNQGVLTWVMFHIINKFQHKSIFRCFPSYYIKLLESIGYFNQMLLLIITEVIKSTCVPPSTEMIDRFIKQPINYESVSQFSLSRICQIFSLYVQSTKDQSMYSRLFDWISDRIDQKHSLAQPKIQLIKMLTVIINKDQLTLKDICCIAQHKLMHQIIDLAKYNGQIVLKQEAVNCLTNLIQYMNPQYIVVFVQEHHVLEMLKEHLENDQDVNSVFKTLAVLALILDSDHRFVTQAQSIGFMPLLFKFYNFRIIKIAEMASQVLDLFNDKPL